MKQVETISEYYQKVTVTTYKRKWKALVSGKLVLHAAGHQRTQE